MKRILSALKCNRSHRLVARFGSAVLVRCKNGRLELRGGSRADYIEAKEWISLCMHEAVLAE